MNKYIVLLVLALIVLCKSIDPEDIQGLEFLPNFLPKHAGEKYCATEDIWKWKKAMISMRNKTAPQDCRIEGPCDNLVNRNKWNNAPELHIHLYITVICSSATSCPGNINAQRVQDQINQINIDFKGTGVVFDYITPNFVVDSQYAVIPAYSQFNTAWYTALLNLKNKYAYQPRNYLNIFITGQTQGTQGTLLGIGTFPWDSAAVTNTGGLWVNANYVGAGQKTASHEIGHNVGLWHTFHGDSEVSCTSDCYETVHADSGDDTISNFVGDFCADTPAQPMNYACSYPTGRDCKGNSYTLYGNNPALLNNFMSYTPDSCYTAFSNQQAMRAHCWVCGALPNWVDQQSCSI
jgi:hypothetical protein